MKLSFGRRITELASVGPSLPAVTCGAESLSRKELEDCSNRLARDFVAMGVGIGDLVTIALPNSTEWFVATIACWKVGATPQPVSAALPRRELDAIVDLARPKVVIGGSGETAAGRTHVPAGYEPSSEDVTPLPDVVPPSWKAPTSGGSTGRPKLIVSAERGIIDLSTPPPLHLTQDGCLVMPGPLYHNGPFVWSLLALLRGNHVVVLPHFDAEATLRAIEEHRADALYVVPTMMKRIWRLGPDTRSDYDLSSLRVVWHLAEPCPAWLKAAWIEWLGAEKIHEMYGGTEGQASTTITGAEWLEHRGSVGRPFAGEIKIVATDGSVAPPGTVGEVWLRPTSGRATYRYIGAEARRDDDGWESLGDMGWLDADGYLYLSDRKQDMILSGGANVYPAEVESAVLEHPAVRSCAVIGMPDDDLGNRVHAVVEADGLDAAELIEFLAERLVRYKIPRTIEFVDVPLRDDAGKVRRAQLRAERISALTL